MIRLVGQQGSDVTKTVEVMNVRCQCRYHRDSDRRVRLTEVLGEPTLATLGTQGLGVHGKDRSSLRVDLLFVEARRGIGRDVS